ncbi:Flp family type IVb pilin [Nocardioides panacis]|uniref:Flp family type IVb pilin n=1 Tax=Nocardioides panacis TaxID=2849501 RepID=A0A975XYJ4_9ACTN|nr:Flp family type IVb pilin [Nocardioides panacis]QWZ06368.1 Flp family type IVb pilin [Nocardioides panacis]
MIEAVEYLRIRLAGLCKSERGASAVEYGLLVSLIAIAIIVAVTTLGTKLSTVFTNTSNSLKTS